MLGVIEEADLGSLTDYLNINIRHIKKVRVDSLADNYLLESEIEKQPSRIAEVSLRKISPRKANNP